MNFIETIATNFKDAKDYRTLASLFSVILTRLSLESSIIQKPNNDLYFFNERILTITIHKGGNKEFWRYKDNLIDHASWFSSNGEKEQERTTRGEEGDEENGEEGAKEHIE